MAWSALTLVSDADLGALEPEATAAAAPWGATTWANQRAEAKRDVKIWLESDYSRIRGVADKVLDTYKPDVVLGYTGAAFTDYTIAASDDTDEDIDLSAVFTTIADDRLYVAYAGEMDALYVKLLDSVNAIASVLTVKYWGDSQWTSISATDGTTSSGKTFAKSGRLTWTLPANWTRRTMNGDSNAYFWLELSVSAALTAGTSASQILAVRAPDGLKRVTAYRALGYIFKGLAAQAAVPDGWLMRVNNRDKTGYWDLADTLYARLRDQGGIPIDVDSDETIDPEEGETLILSPIRMGRA